MLVDDCSTDPYPLELLEQYAAKDIRIRIISPEKNSSQAFCRNLGIQASCGKYFTLIDHDDSFAVIFIESAHAAIVKYKTDMVMANICQYMDDSIPEAPSKWGNSNFSNLPSNQRSVIDLEFIVQHQLIMLMTIFVYSKFFDKERYLKESEVGIIALQGGQQSIT